MPTWKEKKDQGIQNHYEREIITIFVDPKLTNEFCPWRRETLYGAPCMASWGGEEGPHEGIISGRDVPEIAERLGDSVPSD